MKIKKKGKQETLALEKVKAGLNLQEVRHQGQKYKIASIDLKVINLIQQHYTEENKHEINLYWKKDCEVREKQIGRSFNKKRKMVFQNLGDRKKQQKKTKTNQEL